MSQRKAWIDGLRGLAMLFVIYGHLTSGIEIYSLYSTPIKLPLFFAISGYVFSLRDGSTRIFLKKQWQRLLLPWLAFSVLYTVFKIISGAPFGEAMYEFLSGNVAWYIPCLIVAEAIFFAVRRSVKPASAQYLLLAAIAAGGYAVSRFDSALATFAARAMIAQFYMAIGYAFRSLEDRIGKPKLWPSVFGVVFVLAGVYSIVFDIQFGMDVQSSSYYPPLLCAIMVVSGCAFLMYYARWIKMPGWLTFIGRNTLIFYLFHGRILAFFEPLIGKIPHGLRSNVLTGLPISLAICALLCGACAVCSILIRRHLPFLAGISGSNSKNTNQALKKANH